ncbi:Calx-beta domain-containing protein, partial [Acinetobacter baumannii]
IYKGTRTFNVTLSNPSSGASLVRATGVVSIIDNEVVPRISISNVTVVEGGSAVLTVTQSGATNTAVSVNYSTANGSATAPEDYAAASGAVT